MKAALLYTPYGPVNAAREEVALPPEYLKMLAVLGDTSEDIKLGLHCTRCKQDVRANNDRFASAWTMECGCRTFVGRNPIPAKNRN